MILTSATIGIIVINHCQPWFSSTVINHALTMVNHDFQAQINHALTVVNHGYTNYQMKIMAL